MIYSTCLIQTFLGWLVMVEIPQSWLLDYSWFYCVFWIDEFPGI